ncbi:hypothetical protein BJV74DRAFT_830429 [Russula compacta]|nr:hypothetical protein BJV74DRAFT_830429 [Russula compacta]
MSYLGSSNRDLTGREDAMSRHSFLSDSSIPEDLLAKLHDFPLVPGEFPLHAGMLPVIYQAASRVPSEDSSSIASPVIGATSETVFGTLPSEEEGDVTGACVRASRILRAHPGLVMEHYDPTTSVHTFKIAYPHTPQDESPLLSSPATPSLSNSSSSTPSSPSMQAPPSGTFRQFRSASSLSRGLFDSRSTSSGLHRVTSSTSSSASESLNSVLQHHPPLRRTASEHSERGSQYASRRSEQDMPSPILYKPSSSIHSSAAERLARRPALHVAGASPEPGDPSSSPASSSYLRLLDAPRPRGNSFMSSGELLAFREFLARRAEDVLTEARDLSISPHLDQHPSGFDEFYQEAASDRSEYGDSISTGRRFSLLEPDKTRGDTRQRSYNPPHPDTTSVFTGSDTLDGTSTKGDLLHALSIIRAERQRVSSDSDSLLPSGDTFLDLYARTSSPASLLRSELRPCNPHASHSQHCNSPQSQLAEPPTPVTSTSISFEEMQDFLPDFLDLGPDGDYPGSITNEVSLLGSSGSYLVYDKRLASVPEGSAADHCRDRNAMGVESNQAGTVLAKLPPPMHLSPRKVQSAAEIDSGRSQHASPLPSRQGYSQPWNAHSDLPPSNPYGRRAYHQTPPVHATVSADVARGSYTHHGYDNGTGLLAEHAERAHGRGIAEPDNPPRGGPSYPTRVQNLRSRGGQHREPGLRIAVDSSSPREFLSHDVGPVLQRPRAMTLQEVAVSNSPTPDRLHRSSSVTASTSTSSSHRGSRYRTLSDRAYRHPDVPYSPLFSDMDYVPLPQGARHGIPTPRSRQPFIEHDIDDPQVSSPETGNPPLIHSRDLSSGEVYLRNASPRPPRPRPRVGPGLGRNDTYHGRERPAQAHVHRSGSSPDLRREASASYTTGLPSSNQGIGLSLVDNGAFEAPRPAPEPRARTQDKGGIPSHTVQWGPPPTIKKPADDHSTPSSYLIVAESPTGFGALSFRRSVWSKKQKQSPRSDSPAGQLRSAGNSESDLKSSFISVLEHDTKPQRKGLLFRRRT